MHCTLIAGAVQGLVAVVNVVGHLIGSPLAAYVYSQTAGFYTGAVFVLGAALLALIVSIALWVAYTSHGDKALSA